MLQQLLGRLKTSIQLPECLRVMGYLRRIAAFSEAELRLQFLACRDEWIAGLVDELDDSDSYEYVKHLTDVHRLHLFDAVMQYRAIFFDTVPTSAAAGAGAGQVRWVAGDVAGERGVGTLLWDVGGGGGGASRVWRGRPAAFIPATAMHRSCSWAPWNSSAPWPGKVLPLSLKRDPSVTVKWLKHCASAQHIRFVVTNIAFASSLERPQRAIRAAFIRPAGRRRRRAQPA